MQPARREWKADRLTEDDRGAPPVRPAPAGHDRRSAPTAGSTSAAGRPVTSAREKDRRSGAILSFKPDGSDLRSRRDRAPQPVRARLRRRHALRVRQRPRRPRQERAGRDDRADQAGRRLRLARLLGELAAPEAAGVVPRRDAAGRVPRAALLGELTRALGRNDDRGRVGPVPERALGPEARPGERPDRPFVDVRRRLRAPVRASPSSRVRWRPRRATGAAAWSTGSESAESRAQARRPPAAGRRRSGAAPLPAGST